MAFDPTKPVEGTSVDTPEMREQLNSLKALIDDLQAQINAQPATMDQMQTRIQTNADDIVDLRDDVNALQGNNS